MPDSHIQIASLKGLCRAEQVHGVLLQLTSLVEANLAAIPEPDSIVQHVAWDCQQRLWLLTGACPPLGLQLLRLSAAVLRVAGPLPDQQVRLRRSAPYTFADH